eukprot:TRINITY_DN2140_c0_g3_i1.p1 TRINITY_DN2140_c0_g3~~TRINITY_DN2140_c0_g3_i1.p1  ORF type:complete len:210 (-),score=44.43 TRINITY_DN2140_c0_g3_i1:112-741(-)
MMENDDQPTLKNAIEKEPTALDCEVYYALLQKNNYDLGRSFLEACNQGEQNIVKVLIERNVDINSNKNEHGKTGLMLASWKGNQEIVEVLVNQKADVNLTDNNGDTALINACHFRHKGIVELLIDHKADVNHQNGYGKTGLMVASSWCEPELCSVLMGAKANPFLQNYEGIDALEMAKRAATKGWGLTLVQRKGLSDVIKVLESSQNSQ